MIRKYRYAVLCAAVSFPAVPVVAVFGLVAAGVLELLILGGVAGWTMHR